MTQLEQLREMKNLPFFTNSNDQNTEKDRNDYAQYRKIENEIETAAKQLKKGDTVQFEWAEKTGKKNVRNGLPEFKYVLLTGIITVPVKVRKREMFGEDCSIDVIKVESGNYIYPVSPDRIVKI